MYPHCGLWIIIQFSSLARCVMRQMCYARGSQVSLREAMFRSTYMYGHICRITYTDGAWGDEGFCVVQISLCPQFAATRLTSTITKTCLIYSKLCQPEATNLISSVLRFKALLGLADTVCKGIVTVT